MQLTKAKRRQRIRYRLRRKINGTAERPRLSVFRSNKGIYAQLVDDVNGVTLGAASTQTEGVSTDGNKTDQAKAVGMKIAEVAKAAGIEAVVFDRAGYLYHGRVKALADGAREGGLKL